MSTSPSSPWTPEVGDAVLVIPSENPDGEFIGHITAVRGGGLYAVQDQDGGCGDYTVEEMELYG